MVHFHLGGSPGTPKSLLEALDACSEIREEISCARIRAISQGEEKEIGICPGSCI